MTKVKCPNCGEYKFEEKIGRGVIGLGFIIFSIIGFLFTPGSSEFYGGDISFGDVGGVAVLGVVIGILLILSVIFFPSKTVKYKCKNCDYEEKFNKS